MHFQLVPRVRDQPCDPVGEDPGLLPAPVLFAGPLTGLRKVGTLNILLSDGTVCDALLGTERVAQPPFVVVTLYGWGDTSPSVVWITRTAEAELRAAPAHTWPRREEATQTSIRCSFLAVLCALWLSLDLQNTGTDRRGKTRSCEAFDTGWQS